MTGKNDLNGNLRDDNFSELLMDEDYSDGMELDDDDIAQTNHQLFKIEKKIQSQDISKKERRLL